MNDAEYQASSIARQASYWIERATQGAEMELPDDSPSEEFGDWIRRSPDHVREFFTMCAVTQLIREGGAERCREIEALRNQKSATKAPLLAERPAWSSTYVPNVRIRQWVSRALGREPGGIVAWGLLAAAILLVSWWSISDTKWVKYSTLTGQARSIPLADGSRINLSESSKVRIAYGKRNREVVLEHGRASFDVVEDTQRPFSVEAPPWTVHVVGTGFDVDRRGDQIVVSVTRGTVQVEHTRSKGKLTDIRAGSRASLSSNGDLNLVEFQAGVIPQLGKPRTSRAILFQGTVGEIAADFNARNHTPEVVVESEAQSEPLKAIIKADDSNELVNVLRQKGLDVEAVDGRFVVRRREGTN